jgi:flagellar hook-associated protein 2
MSGPITFTGLSSGIDTQAIIDKLLEIERRPVNLLLQKQVDAQRRLEFFQDLHSRLSSFDSAVNKLNLITTVSGKTASASNTNVLGVSAGAHAAEGTFKVNSITQLATAASEGSIGIEDSSEAFAAGTYFNFKVGDESINITLTDDQKTLDGLRSAINTAAAGHARASVINTGTADDPYKLVITSLNTGEDYAITDIDTDIRVTTSGGEADLTLSTAVAAKDAQFQVDGVTIYRSTNTFNDVVEGVTLELKGETASAVTVTVSRDTETLKSALQDFIDNYNEVNSLIQAQFSVDPETGETGFLSGDFTLRQVQQTLQQTLLGGVVDADGNRYSMGSIGVEIDKYTGDLALNEEKFDAAAANADKELFLDLLLPRGIPSDARVSFVNSSHNTEAGTYSINITGYDGEGNVQGTFTKNGDVYTGVGSGQYLAGPKGTDAEGLKVKIASGATGALGSIYFSVGVAERMERQLDEFLTPLIGLLPKMETQYEESIADLDDQIAAFEERIAVRQRYLLQQFIAAEQAISTLQSQTSMFQSQLNSIGGGSLL